MQFIEAGIYKDGYFGTTQAAPEDIPARQSTTYRYDYDLGAPPDTEITG